jgi:hypothetical protein
LIKALKKLEIEVTNLNVNYKTLKKKNQRRHQKMKKPPMFIDRQN